MTFCVQDVEETIGKQADEHIYMTNGCCESVNVDGEVFSALGLTPGEWQGGFYPLTEAESKLLSEMGFYTGREGFVGLTGYSTLYQGKKWLTPVVEIEWIDDERPEDMHAEDQQKAQMMAIQMAARASSRLESIGGYAEVEETVHDVDDRWRVAIHVPLDWAVDRFNSCEEFAAFLTGVTL